MSAPTKPSRAKKKRNVKETPSLGDGTQLEAVMRNPTLWNAAANIPGQTQGYARGLQPVVALLYNAALSIYGNAKKVAAVWEHHRSSQWIPDMLIELAPELYPEDALVPFDAEQLRANWPPPYSQYRDAANTWLKARLHDIRELQRQEAVEQMKTRGWFDPKTGSVTHPVKSRFIHGDGKVITELGKPGVDEDTTEKPRVRGVDQLGEDELREMLGLDVGPATDDPSSNNETSAPEEEQLCETDDRDADDVELDPAPRVHHTGDGRAVVGWKFVKLFAREDTSKSRVIIDVARLDRTSEASLAVEMTEAVAELIGEGLLGVIWDGAIRGEHIRQLAKDSGLLVVAPVAAKKADKKTGYRLEKYGHLETKYHEDAHGATCAHRVYYYGGAVVVEDSLSNTGMPIVRHAPIIKRQRIKSNGTYYWYADHIFTCTRDANHPYTVDLRVTHIEAKGDGAMGLNRAEVLRLVDPVERDGDYDLLYGRRSDAESANNQRDSRRYLRRARTTDPDRVWLEELGEQLLQNSISWYLFQKQAKPRSSSDGRRAAKRAPAGAAPERAA